MKNMRSIEMLKDEHRVIERIIGALESSAKKMESGKKVPADVFESFLEFTRTFSDSCHHGKEEDVLFPLLEKRGIPKVGGPISVMLVEHDLGRNYVKGLDEATKRYSKGDQGAKKGMVENVRGYASLIRTHIDKEDNVLFMMAGHVLKPEDDETLTKKFEKIDEKKIGAETHNRMMEVAKELERKIRNI